MCACGGVGRGIHYWADTRSHTHTNTNTDTHQNKNVNSCFCMSSAAKIICIFIFLYCPMTQWGKIKKSERNDGKTNSELLEAGAFVRLDMTRKIFASTFMSTRLPSFGRGSPRSEIKEFNAWTASRRAFLLALPPATLRVLRLVLRLRRRNGREGMVADNRAKKRETKTRVLMEPQI